MLRGGGSSHVWKVSCIGMGRDVRSNSCWSWMVELLKAFLMVMSWRDTEEQVEKEEIHETKPSPQDALVIFMNSNVILKTFFLEVSWLHLTTLHVCTKNLIQHIKILYSWLWKRFSIVHFVVFSFFFSSRCTKTHPQTHPVHTDTHRWKNLISTACVRKGKVHRVGNKVANYMMMWDVVLVGGLPKHSFVSLINNY